MNVFSSSVEKLYLRGKARNLRLRSSARTCISVLKYTHPNAYTTVARNCQDTKRRVLRRFQRSPRQLCQHVHSAQARWQAHPQTLRDDAGGSTPNTNDGRSPEPENDCAERLEHERLHARRQRRQVEADPLGPRLGRQRARACLLYTSPSPRDMRRSRMPSSA